MPQTNNPITEIKTLAEQYLELLDEAGGELTNEVAQVEQMIVQKGMQIIAPLCDRLEEMEDLLVARKERLNKQKALVSKMEKTIENTKNAIIKIMDLTNVKKITNGALTVKKMDGQPSVEVYDEDAVPDQYKVATVKVKASDLPAVLVVAEPVGEPKIEVSKTAVKKATDGDIGIAGTRIIKKPYLKIEG